MKLTQQDAERLVREGVDALQQGRAQDAQLCFSKIVQAGQANGQIWLLLACACRAQGDSSEEEAALDQLLVLEPRLLRGHLMKGDCRAKAGDDRAALGFYEGALMLAATQQIPDDLITELRRAEAWVAALKSRLDGQREATLAQRGHPPERRSSRFQMSLDILSRRKRAYLQEPTGYYFPELPQIQFYDPTLFDWVPGIEAAAPAIRTELQGLLQEGTQGFRPYLQHDANLPRLDENKLLDSGDWSALFLCENGKRFEEYIERCPMTWQTIQAAPQPHMTNSPTSMFSLLRAGARIAPHTGMQNTRLVCHLPLIVPPGCGFRVGNEVREWEEGKLLIFDDTIEHEAWNDSAQDRVVLIFDIWRPELSEQERAEVAALFCGPSVE